MSRALHVLKLANVGMDPFVATQGQLIGEPTGVLPSKGSTALLQKSSHVNCCSSVHVLAYLLLMLQKWLGITLMAPDQCLSACQ